MNQEKRNIKQYVFVEQLLAKAGSDLRGNAVIRFEILKVFAIRL